MTSIDYMKVLDLAALSLGSETDINVNAIDLNRFKALILSADGKSIEFNVILSEFHIELSVNKEMLNPKEFRKWLPDFEYRLEQNFFKNIVIEDSASSREYIIKIEF